MRYPRVKRDRRIKVGQRVEKTRSAGHIARDRHVARAMLHRDQNMESLGVTAHPSPGPIAVAVRDGVAAASARVVLVAEPDAQLREALAAGFRRERSIVEEFTDASALMSALAAHAAAPGRGRISLVLACLELPGCSGIELIDALEAMGLDVPIVFTTRSNDNALRTRAMAAGDLFFDKPFHVSDLIASARWVLRMAPRCDSR